ncbi:MAG TPA: TSUP family transporter [Acidimicrobiales bacterium]|nr:TSUP family transporter [Acidimicrobiales bacterium]
MLAPLAVGAGAAAQAVTGIGFALVCAPFLVAAEGGREGVRLAILLSALLNTVMVARERRHVRPSFVVLLLVPAALATPVFAVVVRRLPEDVLAGVAGAVILLAVAALAVGLRVRRAEGRGGAIVAGVVSAGMNVASGVGGPPVALYAVNAGWPPRTARASLQAYFLCLNVVALIGLGLPALRPGLLVAMAVGWAAGTLLDRFVPDSWATAAVLTIAGIGGVVALVSSM